MTLEDEIIAQVRANGPMGVDRFMALALGHPRYGYYMTRDPLGLAGDFVTSPEISQIFGELLGLLAATTWQALGEPSEVALVELGPGRGTLMADALRAAKALPGFTAALDVHLVEMSPVLQRAQAAALKDSGKAPQWHTSVASLPEDRPLIILANEFFDAIPIRQFQRLKGEWHERLVGVNAEGQLALGLDPAPAAFTVEAEEGAVFETSPASHEVMRQLAEKIVAQGGLLLAIDYGHPRFSFGDTLQAVRKHKFAPVLENPGEADITAHVDFSALGVVAKRAGARPYPVLTQATFLERMGIHHRAEILRKNAPDPKEIDLAVERLAGVAPEAMGLLFKVLAVTNIGLAPPIGFEQDDPRLKGEGH